MSVNSVQTSFMVKEDSMIMKETFSMMDFGEEDKNGTNDNLLNHHSSTSFKIYPFFMKKSKNNSFNCLSLSFNMLKHE